MGEHGHDDEHGHHHKFKKKMAMMLAYKLVMRCYPEGQLTYEQVKEAAERIHEVKHILKGKKKDDCCA
jgi:hypothetical protein